MSTRISQVSRRSHWPSKVSKLLHIYMDAKIICFMIIILHISQNLTLQSNNFTPIVTPSSHRWYRKFHSYERNGVMNWMLSANWTRIVFPCVFMFFCFYMIQPVLHGSIYINQYNMYQYEAIYAKLTWNRCPPAMQVLTRIA